MLAREAEFGTQSQCARIKMLANGGHFRENMPSDLSAQTGWLGREDSNLRMAESKSAASGPPSLELIGCNGVRKGQSGAYFHVARVVNPYQALSMIYNSYRLLHAT